MTTTVSIFIKWEPSLKAGLFDEFIKEIKRLLCDPDEHRKLICDLISYLSTIKSYNDEKYTEVFQSFIMKIVIKMLTDTKISLGIKEKYESYNSFLQLINGMLLDKINIKKVNTISEKEIKQLFDAFRKSVYENVEINDCLKLYEQICLIFLRPVSAFDKVTVDTVDNYIQTFNEIVQKYGIQNAVSKNLNQVSVLLKFVFIYWQKYTETEEEFEIPVKLIPKLLSLINHQAALFSQLEISSCYRCSSNKCNVNKDIYKTILIKIRILSLLTQIEATLKYFRQIGLSLFKDCINIVSELKDNDCEFWLKSWSLCSSAIFRLIIQYHDNYYEDYVLFSELLCTKIKSFGVETLFKPEENFLAICLHRLGCTHYRNKNYKDAMEVASLSAYVGLSTGQNSSFRTWANCKSQNPSKQSITMVECLESSNFAARFGITISLNNFEKKQLTLLEIKFLENCPMNMVSSIIVSIKFLEKLNPDTIEYAQAIHMLSYHQLNIENLQLSGEFLTSAKLKFNKVEFTSSRQLIYSILLFYSFAEKLADICNTIKTQMLTSTMQGDSTSNVDLDYSLMNITIFSDLEASLKQVLECWATYCEQEGLIESFGKFLTPNMMIRLVIMAGEYAKFYHFLGAEISAWKLAMSLAKKFKDDLSIIYICARGIMSKYLNFQWIALAEQSADKLKDSNDEEIIESIILFKLSLSTYYYNLGYIKKSNNLFHKTLKNLLTTYKEIYPAYIYAMDILLVRMIYDNCCIELEYKKAIIDCLDGVLQKQNNFLSLHNLPQGYLLYKLDIALDFMSHVSQSINSLKSYEQISMYFTHSLRTVHQLGSTLRVAECLKNLCFVNLWCNQLKDCEVNLQKLKSILKLDSSNFDEGTNSKNDVNIVCDNSLKPVKVVRDIPQSDASVVLLTETFSSLGLKKHDKNCKCFNCFKCENFAYNYYVFSYTHISAKLYAALNNVEQAVDHFYEAMEIVKKLIDAQVENFETISLWYMHFVLFLLDFAKFIKDSKSQTGADTQSIIDYAISICIRYNIKNHLIYLRVKELVSEDDFQNNCPDYAGYGVLFVAPDAEEEIVSKKMTFEGDVCTPVR
ncbi:GSCOCG00010980001-RA-CDS, partial [Cotesia congregata]